MVSLEFIIPHYWSKTLSALYPVPHESENFLVWLVGAGIIPGLVWTTGSIASDFFQWIFPWLCVVSLHAYISWYSAEYEREVGSGGEGLSWPPYVVAWKNLKVVIRVIRRAYLICFPSLRDHYPLLQTIVWCFVFFFFFLISRRVNPVPFALSWSKAEVPIWIFDLFILFWDGW